MKTVPLTQGKVAIIDDADFAEISKHKWSFCKGYAVRCLWNHTPGHHKLLGMHRAILKAPDGVSVDHADGNPLNNQRSNLRLATRSQQNQNTKRCKRNKSGFKGVHLHKDSGLWRVIICKNKKREHIGYFRSPKSAAAAYRDAAIRLFGKFARFA